MTHFTTCTGCRLKGECAHAEGLKAKIKGLGIRSMKFGCKLREDIFAPGQPVIFDTFANDDSEEGWCKVRYKGRVIKQMGGKVFGYIKPGSGDLTVEWPFKAKANGYVKMPLARVRADDTRDVADARCCDWCQSYPGLGAECLKDPEHTPAEKCLADAINTGGRSNG